MKKNRIIQAFIILAIFLTFAACSNMHMGTHMGVDVRFGPNGPSLQPSVGLDMYSGGRY